MGRKPAESEPRSMSVLLRVLPIERERWKAAAKRAGLTVSEWLRGLANGAAQATKGSKR